MHLLIDILRAGFGIAVLLGICYLLSSNRSAINWRLVFIGVGLQISLALLILKVPGVSLIFDFIAGFFRQLLEYSKAGAEFVFGPLGTENQPFGVIFAFQVLPVIVFFSALTAMLYYLGILQWIIRGAAVLMKRAMGITGPESLAVAANIFVGMTEAPLVVRPYLEKFTRSEIMLLMTGGMATIAGSVFAAYVGFLGGDDPEQQQFFAKHLLTASIISAPAAIVTSKMLVPETEESLSPDELHMKDANQATNILDAISRGTADGLRLAVNVGVMLLAFVALIYMFNQLLINGPGNWFHLNDLIRQATDNRFEGLTFTYLIGMLFAPFAWLLGTPVEDMILVGQLLGQKTVINEFVAYQEFNNIRATGIEMQPKSVLIATYALCGFSNFASIGIQIGGIGALAPGKRQTLTELGLKSLIAGTIACFTTGAIAGVLA